MIRIDLFLRTSYCAGYTYPYVFIAYDVYHLKQVAAFRATLEEISDSSLLLHVMDVRYFFTLPSLLTFISLLPIAKTSFLW